MQPTIMVIWIVRLNTNPNSKLITLLTQTLTQQTLLVTANLTNSTDSVN